MKTSHTITGHGLTATFLEFGAILQDLRLDGHAAPLVLGLADTDHYPEHSNYMGATAGRFANRIGQGQFQIDGVTYQADQNFLGAHLLHGGAEGTGKLLWSLRSKTDETLTLGITLADGHMGFPGEIGITATFECAEGATLRVTYSAQCDAPTLCNLAHHSYFILDDSGDVSGHTLTVHADRYTPVDDQLIPVGAAPVDGTPFDFRAGRSLPGDGLLDHNLCIADARGPLREVAVLRSSRSGVAMRVCSTEPGLQVYDGAKLNTQVPGLDGRTYRAHAGVALEPQVWPDAPNHAGFPSAVLRPGETYEQITEFSFSKD